MTLDLRFKHRSYVFIFAGYLRRMAKCILRMCSILSTWNVGVWRLSSWRSSGMGQRQKWRCVDRNKVKQATNTTLYIIKNTELLTDLTYVERISYDVLIVMSANVIKYLDNILWQINDRISIFFLCGKHMLSETTLILFIHKFAKTQFV